MSSTARLGFMGETKTPAELLVEAIEQLEAIEDPATRAAYSHKLQEAMKGSTARVRAITDGAVQQLRERGASRSELSEILGGVSLKRVTQIAAGKHGAGRTGPSLIYAFRVADVPDAPWYGNTDSLAEGEYEAGYIDFKPAVHNRFAGHRLELRYGPVPDDGLNPVMHAYTTVNRRRVRMLGVLQELLFAPE